MKQETLTKLIDTKDSLSSAGLRLSAKTPLFFKRILWIMAVTGAVGLALSIAPNVPETLSSISGYMIAVGIAGAVIAKMAVDFPRMEEEKES